MRLSAKTLKNYININTFQHTSEWIIREEQPNTLYFQLVDLDKDSLRYIPTNPATVKVTFPSIDNALVIEVDATQPDALDGSIWQIDLDENQTPHSGNFLVEITEDGITRKFFVLQGIVVEELNNGGC